MSEATQTTAIKPEIQALRQKLLANMKLDGDVVNKTVEGELFDVNRPVDVPDIDAIKRFQTYRSNFLAASELAVSDLALPAMRDNKDLTNVVFEGAIGVDNFSVDLRREFRHLSAPGSSEMTTSFGHTRVKYEANLGAVVRTARDIIKQNASQMFGNASVETSKAA